MLETILTSAATTVTVLGAGAGVWAWRRRRPLRIATELRPVLERMQRELSLVERFDEWSHERSTLADDRELLNALTPRIVDRRLREQCDQAGLHLIGTPEWLLSARTDTFPTATARDYALARGAFGAGQSLEYVGDALARLNELERRSL